MLDTLFESGQLQILVERGLISPKALTHREIYHAFESSHQQTGSTMQAMQDTADQFGVSVSTVEKIRQKLSVK
jgi:hypothetical protein